MFSSTRTNRVLFTLFLFIVTTTSLLAPVKAIDILPPHRRPFPNASIVAASIAGAIVFAGMALACLLALPRILLFIRARLMIDEEEEEAAGDGAEEGNEQKNEIELKHQQQNGANTNMAGITGNYEN
ncbi:hypothetical protein FDP41_006840 [Naegleria fowleri]|uniref:Uncharacterized protein n=1 Tax=Naegleria fowleri TaxID=5763 RepID=A0A6A5BJM3_NAEFO|nr:uncharacterized protein FDP41_006840 [Naegleria fowleri]KAF0974230.1 hypothetical protein FDP41_006840 [Naegleria fowleri]